MAVKSKSSVCMLIYIYKRLSFEWNSLIFYDGLNIVYTVCRSDIFFNATNGTYDIL